MAEGKGISDSKTETWNSFSCFSSEFMISFQVSKLGFGCMGLTGVYNSPVADEDGISIIKDAFSKGITFFDTSDVYGPHLNEVLVGKVCMSLRF